MRTIVLRVEDEDFEKLQSLKKKGESWEAMFLRELRVKEMKLGYGRRNKDDRDRS